MYSINYKENKKSDSYESIETTDKKREISVKLSVFAGILVLSYNVIYYISLTP